MSRNSSEPKREPLKHDQACLPCKKRHKACQGVIPCQQCKDRGMADSCEPGAGQNSRTNRKQRRAAQIGRLIATTCSQIPPVENALSPNTTFIATGSSPPRVLSDPLFPADQNDWPWTMGWHTSPPRQSPHASDLGIPLSEPPIWPFDKSELGNGTIHGPARAPFAFAAPLVRVFLDHAEQFGLFIDAAGFLDLTADEISLSANTPPQPLIEAAILCGSSLMSPLVLCPDIESLRDRAMNPDLTELDKPESPSKNFVDLLQVGVLMINWCNAEGNFRAATFYSHAAVKIAQAMLDDFNHSIGLPSMSFQGLCLADVAFSLHPQVPDLLVCGIRALCMSIERLATLTSLPDSLLLSPLETWGIVGILPPDLCRFDHLVENHQLPIQGPGLSILPAMIMKGSILFRRTVVLYTGQFEANGVDELENGRSIGHCHTGIPNGASTESVGDFGQVVPLLLKFQEQLKQLSLPGDKDPQYKHQYALAWALYLGSCLICHSISSANKSSAAYEELCARYAQGIIELGRKLFEVESELEKVFNPVYGILVTVALKFLVSLSKARIRSPSSRRWIDGLMSKGISLLRQFASTSVLLKQQLAVVTELKDPR